MLCVGLALLQSSGAYALPGRLGLSGLDRILSAGIPSPNTYRSTVSASYEYSVVSDSVHLVKEDYGVDTVLAVEDSEHYVDARFLFGLGITENVEAAVTVRGSALGFRFDQVSPRDRYVGYLDASWAMADVSVAAKYGHIALPWLEAGGAVWIRVPLSEAVPDTITDHDGYWDAGEARLAVRRPFVSGGKTAFGLTALGTASWRMVRGHLNLGYVSLGQTYEDSLLGRVDERVGALDIGVGVEARSPMVTGFLELWTRSFGSRAGPGYGSPAVFTGGMRLYEGTGAYLDVAGHIGLSSFHRREADPRVSGKLPVPGGVPGDLGLTAALGYDLGMVGEGGRDSLGVLSGTVTDGETGEPLEATVGFPDTPVTPAVTDPSTGFFTTRMFAGTVVARAEAEGYLPLSRTVIVPPGGAAAADFRLLPEGPEEGEVAGTVTDYETGEPVSASVTASGTGASAEAGSSGAFSLSLPAGTHTLTAAAEGYLDATEMVSVPAGGTATAEIRMRHALEQGQVMSFANIYFDSGSATLKPSSFSVLDGVVELLRENAGVRVEIAGHTDSDGSASYNQGLSRRRAESVRDYLVRKGISASRLTTVGYGETQPVASNATADGKAQNRRIEFRVL
jgi:outer membrane protein OmpA-like peptidoglycan-associated protein